MDKKKIITAIVCAALIGGITEAAGFFPNLVHIFAASTALISAISAYVIGQK